MIPCGRRLDTPETPRGLFVSILTEAGRHGPLKIRDEELVGRALEGDAVAFAKLVERYRDAAYGIGLHVLGDPHEAAEVAQDAFVQAWKALNQLREPAKFAAWLCTITRNLARRRLSARVAAAAALSLEEVEEMAAPHGSPADNAEQAEVTGIIRQVLGTLPDEQRLAFTLFYVNGYSYGDLSNMLSVPEGTVKTHLYRAAGTPQEGDGGDGKGTRCRKASRMRSSGGRRQEQSAGA